MTTALRAPLPEPVSCRQSALPAAIQALRRPQALGRATELAFLRWEKQNLDATATFWRDFGLQVQQASPTRLLARGAGPSACVAVAEHGAHNRLLGIAFRMSADTDLAAYVQQAGATWLEAAQIPGGGRGVALTDPAGRSLWLLQGQAPAAPLPHRDPVTTMNAAGQRPRINRTVRTPVQPAQVLRLGHVVLQTLDFQGLAHWYMRMLGLIPTDVQYLPDGSPNLAFCRLDLGSEPADHHTVVFVGGIEEKYEHSAYEVVDLDALGQGQQVLRAQGHRHVWGIGRHVLGSQLFDYWRDPDGFEYEHYTDGDVFTADHETEYSPLTFGSIWAWGQDAPASMKPRKNLRNLLRIVGHLRAGRLSTQRLKLISAALDAPARPWL
jgi:hypothetical protein